MLGDNVGQLDAMLAIARRMDCKALKRKCVYGTGIVRYNNASPMSFNAYVFPNGSFVYYSTLRMGYIVSASNGSSMHGQNRPFPYLTRALRACYVIDQFIPIYLDTAQQPIHAKAVELHGMIRVTLHDSWMFTQID